MKGVYKLSALLLIVLSSFAFIKDEASTNHGITVEKSITLVKENLYQVSFKIINGNEVNGIAKYETKLPLAADFVKEVSKDKSLNVKLDGRTIKILWLHIQKNSSYSASFQISTKKAIDAIQMDGKVFGHIEGQRFSFEEKSAFLKF